MAEAEAIALIEGLSEMAMFHQLELPPVWIELLEIQSNGVHDPSAEVIALTGY